MNDRTKWLEELSSRLNINNAEAPSDEWFSAFDLAKVTGLQMDSVYRRLHRNEKLETKKFLVNGKWISFYREIQKCQEKPSKSSKGSSVKNKHLVSRMAAKLK